MFEAFQEGCHETEHFSRLSEQRVLHSQGQLLAASATEKDCLLLGLLSGQMREIAVSLAHSTTAAGQRKRISFEYRVHGERRFHLCTAWINQAEENSKTC